MATKNQQQISHQQIEGDVGKGKQKNAGAGQDGKNRRALGDIGNVVVARAVAIEGKPVAQVHRPLTRSFATQIPTNPQAAVAHKKAVGDGAAKKANNREATAKVAAKPKPEVTIEISPKAKAKAKPNPDVVIEISPDSNEKLPQRRSMRKKVHTMTSVLAARSKAAFLVPDIDASDVSNEFAVVDYIEDIYIFYKQFEHTLRPHDYMDSQVEINAKMRAILADWLLEVSHKFELMPESLYLTFYIIDRYLSLKKVLRKELQLVGVSAMLIACKYEEIWAPEVNDFICISDRAYSREQILSMEKDILNQLEWSLTVPTPYVFLLRFLKAAMADKEMEHMACFFAELGLMQYSMVMFSPSMFAASAVYAARCTLKKSPKWTETLEYHTGFSETELLNGARILVKRHAVAPEDKLKFVYKKYSGAEFGAVALNPPATAMLQESKGTASNSH